MVVAELWNADGTGDGEEDSLIRGKIGTTNVICIIHCMLFCIEFCMVLYSVLLLQERHEYPCINTHS